MGRSRCPNALAATDPQTDRRRAEVKGARGEGEVDRPSSRRPVIVVFGKAPKPGAVKTRMCPPLTPEQASELYTQLLDDVLETTAAIAARLGLDAVLALHPPAACAEIAARAPTGFRVIAQCGAGLAERMSWAAGEAAATGADRVLLRGSDSPVLSQQAVELALASLDDHDLVVSPDLDGGYGLIGLRAPTPGLFDHPMSTHTVLEETLANAARAGLRVHRLAPSFDLDRVEDLERLRDAALAGHADTCPRTIAYLDEHDLWRFIRSSNA